eukprot:scaffold266783_cov35-Tisochrysis_lutea.AAC.3
MPLFDLCVRALLQQYGNQQKGAQAGISPLAHLQWPAPQWLAPIKLFVRQNRARLACRLNQ